MSGKKNLVKIVAGALICALALAACGTSKDKGTSKVKDRGDSSSKQVENSGSEKVSEIDDLRDETRVNLYGRNYYSDEMKGYAFVNSAAGFEVKIRGTKLAASVKTGGSWQSQFSVFVDGEKDSNTIKVKMPKTTLEFKEVELVSGLSDGEHVVKVLKRTPSNRDTCYVEKLTTDGAFLNAPDRPAISLDIYGDSITCGEGVLRSVTLDPATGKYSDSNIYTADTQNVFQSYAGVAARLLDADFRVFGRGGIDLKYAASGYSVLSNCDSIAVDMDATKYPYNWDSYKPSAVVIYLGTNDYNHGRARANLGFSLEGLEDAFKQFIREVIGSHYGNDIPIVLCSGMMVDLNSSMENVVNELKAEFPNIAHVRFSPCAAGHPVASEGEVAGQQLADKLKEMLRVGQ